MNRLLLILIIIALTGNLNSSEVLRFKVRFEDERIDAPVFVQLDGIDYNTDKGGLVLYEETSAGLRFIPSQLEPGHSARLWFVLEGITSEGTTRSFILKSEIDPDYRSPDLKVNLQKHHNDLQLVYDDKPLLNYRFGLKFPPRGVNPLFKRSGYIHPLWSPGGAELTRIQPPDHYHHYGIWGPWTKTHIDQREVDFWNLAKGEGSVKFAGFISLVEGGIYSGFEALQQHIDFGALGPDQIAMNELLEIRVWNAGDNIRIIDYTTSLTSPLENGIMLDAYRYGGGIGFRATEKWHKDNCTVITSEGKTRVDADGSSARWCIVEGESDTDEGRSGILFLSHPSNRMHPEPMRVWPLDANRGRGDMFFEFTPIRYEDWKIEPNRKYTLKYRMIVFDGSVSITDAERYWNSFATNPFIEFITAGN